MLALKDNTMREYQVRERTIEQQSPKSRTRPRLSLRERVATCLSITFCIGTIWFIAGKGAQVDKLNYQVDHMQSAITQTQAANETLANQVNQLKQPSRILGVALGRLHMTQANPVQIQSGSN